MNMHDNDMDELFRSKLDDFEQEPSAAVWNNISTELHGAAAGPQKLIPLLRIAASIAVLMAAGLFFLPKAKKADRAQPVNRLVKSTPVKTPIKPLQSTVSRPVNKVKPVKQVAGIQVQQQIAAVHYPKTKTLAVPAAIVKKPAMAPEQTDALANTQPAAALAAEPGKGVITPSVVPDTETSLKGIDDAPAAISKPVLAAANPPAGNDAKPTIKKHKAHGLGGILNAVIGAVDKRQDKIIEFADTDEGDSVTGINLGIVKIKKQK